jgi:hypothetical protein
MAILDSSSLGSLIQHVKAYVTNQINVTLNTRTISKATSDAQGNVISDTYATKTYANTAINTAVNNLSSSSNFLKSASVDGNTLTITKGNDSDVTYNPDLSWSNVTNKPSVFTPDSHNQASSTINSLAGYSIASSESNINSSDTLNTALGKLQLGVNNRVLKKSNRSIEYIKGTQTASTPTFTGVTEDDSLYDGKTIAYYLPYAGTSAGDTLNLTLSTGINTGDKPVWYRDQSTRLTTHYPDKTIVLMTYIQANDCWVCGGQFNTTYSALTAADATTGTATTGRLITAKVLHDKVTQASYYYGSCSTAAGTAAKTVEITGFKLTTGVRVVVKFTVTNSAASPTLNVTSTGAKAIYYRSAAITAGYLAANRTYEFVYNGTQYELVGDLDTNSTGYLPTSGGTVTGTVVLSKTTDASGTANNSPALIVGGAATAAHMELDADEIMAKTNGTSVKAIYMNNDGGAVYLCNAATGVYLNASNGLLPRTTKKLTLGGSSNLWTTVYANTATISTSDKRLKDLINNIPDDVLDVWDKINWQQFKMKDSISEKGIENARLHTGLVAQDVEKVFNDNNLDPRKYGFFCFDKWDAEPAVYSASGKLMQEAKEAGESFSIRYEEALVIEAAYQRRKNKQLEDRIKDLEDKIQQLLNNNSVN